MTPATQAALPIIKRWEGLRLKSYLCPANVWTIGYGTTKDVKPGMTITEAEAERMLAEDVAEFEKGVRAAVKVPLADHQLAALISFAYNVGLGAFRTSTLLRLVNKSEFDSAAKQFDRWTKGGGKVLPGLVKRRAAERELFERKP